MHTSGASACDVWTLNRARRCQKQTRHTKLTTPTINEYGLQFHLGLAAKVIIISEFSENIMLSVHGKLDGGRWTDHPIAPRVNFDARETCAGPTT